jgi:hypothetical protein
MPVCTAVANKGFAAEDLLFGFRCIALLDARVMEMAITPKLP